MKPEELTILNILINEIRDSTPTMRPQAINNYKVFMEAVTARLALKRNGHNTWVGEEGSLTVNPVTTGYDPATATNPGWYTSARVAVNPPGPPDTGWRTTADSTMPQMANSRNASNF